MPPSMENGLQRWVYIMGICEKSVFWEGGYRQSNCVIAAQTLCDKARDDCEEQRGPFN